MFCFGCFFLLHKIVIDLFILLTLDIENHVVFNINFHFLILLLSLNSSSYNVYDNWFNKSQLVRSFITIYALITSLGTLTLHIVIS